MKLVRKLTVALLVSFTGVLALQAWLTLREFADAYENDVARDHRTMARALAAAVATGMRAGGVDAARAMIEEANDQEPRTRIRWVRPDAPPGDWDAPARTGAARDGTTTGRSVTELDRGEGDHGMVYTYAPVVVDGRAVGAIEFAESLEGERRFIQARLLHEALGVIAVGVACGGLAWWLGVRLVGRPVEALIEHARKVGGGDLSARIALRQRDELSLLAGEMSAMTERLQDARRRIEEETAARVAAIDQLRHADRLTTVGRLASGIAHELGTPLNVVSGRAEMIASGEISDTDEIRRTAVVIGQQSDRIVQILRQLLDFARRKPAERAPADLIDLGRETVELLQPLARKRRIALQLVNEAGRREVEIDVAQIQQVLTNLVMNAVQASPDDGEVRVRVSERAVAAAEAENGARRWACVEVVDHGAGMTADVRARIFDPFFTTKPVGEGTGLGLSVAYGIVSDHGGWIDVASEPGKGSTFTVWLPLEASAA